MTLEEDEMVNRLKESLQLFRSIWINRWLSRVSVILFLNKYDVFVEKITSGQYKLENYFPEYKKFKAPHDQMRKYRVENENSEVLRAKLFILVLVMEVTYENLEDAIKELQETNMLQSNHEHSHKKEMKNGSLCSSSYLQKSAITSSTENLSYYNRDIHYKMSNNNYFVDNTQKFCIPHFTCAVDTENIKKVFKACNKILQKEHLEKSGLM